VRPELIQQAKQNIPLTATRPTTTPTISPTGGALLVVLFVVLFAVVLVLLLVVLLVVEAVPRVVEVARLTISFPRLSSSGRMCGRSSENIDDEGALGCGKAVVMMRKRKREMREALEVVNFMISWS
jgi:hypothetical protein